MILNKERGEFNFNMFEGKNSNLQYQARHHEESKAVHKLHYEIKTVKKLSKLERKQMNYLMKVTSKAQAANVEINGLGVLRDYS